MNLLNHSQRLSEAKSSEDIDQNQMVLDALDTLLPCGQQQKNALFANAYPGILRAIARKVSQKNILAALSRSGLKLHPIRYRTMLEAEQNLRNENGERICCETCGAVLQLDSSNELSSTSEYMTHGSQPVGNDQSDAQS